MQRTSLNHYWCWAVLVTVFAFILYLKTLAPTVIWGDSAKLAIFVNEIKLSFRLEYHPLHTVIGVLFNNLPFGNCAYRLNLMSAFFGALTVYLVYLILVRWTHSVIAALGGAVSLTVSHVFWLLSVINESYTLFTFLMAMMILLITLWDETKKKYFLYLTAFVFGISLSNNLLMPFLLPGFIYFYLSAHNRSSQLKWTWLIVLLFSALGASLLIALAVKSIIAGGLDLFDLVEGGPFRRYYRSPVKMLKEIVMYPAYLMYQFPVLGFAFGFIGVWYQFRLDRRKFMFLFLILFSDLIFASGYMRQKQFYLLIPGFLVFSLWIGIGISAFSSWAANRINHRRVAELIMVVCLIMGPILLYSSMPTIVKVLNFDLVRARSLPYRNNAQFFLVPDKHDEYGAERFGEEVFQILEPKSIIISDFTPIAVLRYFQNVAEVRKDVWLKLIDFEPLNIDFVDKYIGSRPIYIADDLEPDYNIAGLKAKYNLIPIGPIIKIEPKAPLSNSNTN